jgi:hypothetical protein
MNNREIIKRSMEKIEKIFGEAKKYFDKLPKISQHPANSAVIFLLALLVGYISCKIIPETQIKLKFGFVTDFEYGYKDNVGNKPTNKALEALEKTVYYFNKEFHPEIVIAGGDMVESSLSKKPTTIEQFKKINGVFSKLESRRGYVFGNHDLRDLNKEELRNILEMSENHNYFDQGAWRLVLMDTNFKADGSDLGPDFYVGGYVSKNEFDWLREAFDTEKPIILFSHHSPIPENIDGNFISNTKNILNGIELHNFLKQYANLVLVVSGHEPGYKFKNVDGVNYFINGNLSTFEVLSNFSSMEAKYNKYTKKARIVIEKHGENANKFEIKKKIGKFSLWPK